MKQNKTIFPPLRFIAPTQGIKNNNFFCFNSYQIAYKLRVKRSECFLHDLTVLCISQAEGDLFLKVLPYIYWHTKVVEHRRLKFFTCCQSGMNRLSHGYMVNTFFSSLIKHCFYYPDSILIGGKIVIKFWKICSIDNIYIE